MGETSRYKCPTCQRPISWDEAFPYRPFCSERCKMVDFGAWVSGMHAIPGEPALPEDGIAPERDPDRGPEGGAH